MIRKRAAGATAPRGRCARRGDIGLLQHFGADRVERGTDEPRRHSDEARRGGNAGRVHGWVGGDRR